MLFYYLLKFQAYPSNKQLGAWTRDLLMRVDQFEKWATTAHPPVIFWMSGFTFPTGFLTAVLQTSARQNNVSALSAHFCTPVTQIVLLIAQIHMHVS